MEINQVDTVAVSSAGALRAQEPVEPRAEQAAPVSTATGSSGEAFRVELSAEAQNVQANAEAQAAQADQADQAAEAAQDDAARQAANPNLTYNAAGEVTG